ncbi:MAG: sulfurtransferase TusA family protein [Pseudomonadota bacterium]
MTETQKEINQNFDEYLDAKGLNCPLPILKTKVLLNKMDAGAIIKVEATDPHSQIDFEAYCARTKHELVQSSLLDDVYIFFIKRAQSPNPI